MATLLAVLALQMQVCFGCWGLEEQVQENTNSASTRVHCNLSDILGLTPARLRVCAAVAGANPAVAQPAAGVMPSPQRSGSSSPHTANASLWSWLDASPQSSQDEF